MKTIEASTAVAEALETEQIESLTPEEKIDRLISIRQALAPEALRGDLRARQEWKRLTAEIAELEMDAQIAAEARREEERRRAAEEAARLEAERQQQELEFQEATSELHRMLADLEDQIYALVVPVENAVEKAKEVYSAGKNLGYPMRWKMKFDIHRVICQALSPVLHPALEWVAASQQPRSLVPGRALRTQEYRFPVYPSDLPEEVSEVETVDSENEGANDSNGEHEHD